MDHVPEIICHPTISGGRRVSSNGNFLPVRNKCGWFIVLSVKFA
jgi:hypothetical protein